MTRRSARPTIHPVHISFLPFTLNFLRAIVTYVLPASCTRSQPHSTSDAGHLTVAALVALQMSGKIYMYVCVSTVPRHVLEKRIVNTKIVTFRESPMVLCG